MSPSELSFHIKAYGHQLGFDMVGISKAEFLEKEARDLEQWLHENRHGKMQYMENYFDKRTDPRLLVEGAKSVISVIHNYYPQPEHKQPPNTPKVSIYTWGKDYHKVLKQKLYQLFAHIQERVGAEISGRVFVDSAPVLDKAWAKRSGLGWVGKNTNLINPRKGSFFFIGEIILDLELEYDGPIKDYCGSCTRCIDACPTEALQPYQIDASRCISYLTIELKEEIPSQFAGKMEDWAYGCDICQTVCPWNKFSRPHTEDAFSPMPHILTFTQEDWEALDKSQFKRLTKKSAMNRVKWDKMKKNLAFLQKEDQ